MPDEAHFARVGAGMAREQVREQLGEPANVWGMCCRNQAVWSYRFVGPSFCLLCHVGITPDGIVEDTSDGPDLRCERDRQFRFF